MVSTPWSARRRALLSLFTALAIVWMFGPVRAFFATKLQTLNGELGTSHEEMTEDVIEDFNRDAFGLPAPTLSTAMATQEIADANAEVDMDTFHSAKHFDGENFVGGQAFITETCLPRVHFALDNGDADAARRAFGQALHTVQDFYSHSNWVELGNATANTQLGRPGMVIGNTAGALETTCQACIDPQLPVECPDCTNNLVTTKLTSGYFGGEDVVKPGPFKCSHGGVGDTSATGLFGHGINKDNKALCFISPHDHLHDAAVVLAKDSTENFLRDLAGSVSQDQMELLLGIGGTLAFAIDTTPGMGPVLGTIQAEIAQAVDARVGTPEEPSKYVLVPFDHAGVGPRFVTTDAAAFKARLATLAASGPAGCPAPAHAAMLLALAGSEKRSDLFVFTNASAADTDLEGNVSSLAAARAIQVHLMSFGACDATDASLQRVADASGGQRIHLEANEAASGVLLADLLPRVNAVEILSFSDVLGGSPAVISVPVDSSLTRVTFAAGGTGAVLIARPDGTPLLPSDPGASVDALASGVVASVADPEPGAWQVQLSGTGRVSLSVTGESALNLATFRVVKQGGRPGHEGFFPISGEPESGRPAKVVAAMSGAYQTVGFELRTRSGAVLAKPALASGPGQPANEVTGELIPPGETFLPYAVGLDASGVPFQRVLPRPMRGQPVKIGAPAPKSLAPGETTSYVLRVTNGGAPAMFAVRASDDLGFGASAMPSSFPLKTGASLDVVVFLKAPANAPLGTTDTLVATVEVAGDPSRRNFAVLRSPVETAPPPLPAGTSLGPILDAQPR